LERGTAELVRYSADVYSYLTAFSRQPMWGSIARVFPKPEGDLFPGAVTILLALGGVVFWRATTEPALPALRLRPMHWVLLVLSLVHVAAAVIAVFNRRLTIDLGFVTMRMSDVNQLLLRAAIPAILLLVLSPELRARSAAFLRTRGFFVVVLMAAMWLSLGP